MIDFIHLAVPTTSPFNRAACGQTGKTGETDRWYTRDTADVTCERCKVTPRFMKARRDWVLRGESE